MSQTGMTRYAPNRKGEARFANRIIYLDPEIVLKAPG